MVIGNQSHVCRDGDIIGRAGTVACEFFDGVRTASGQHPVSRQHVKVIRRDGRWCIIMLSNQTTTQFDGRPFVKGQSEFLTGEHRLQLSTQCEISLRVSTPERSS